MTVVAPPLALRAETPAAWARAALADPEALLSDHAHCEKKAALVALNLAQHLGDMPQASALLARLAEEELDHYRRVLEGLQLFGWTLLPDRGNAYARELHRSASKGLLDQLLIAALIEARSCERLGMLEQASASHRTLGYQPWVDFLLELERCEAGHALVYRHLAEARFGAEATERRLDWWLDREAEIILAVPWRSAVH